jgi:REP element-mobilizing transposase RayT
VGAFWQNESYDRVVRDSQEFEQFVNYVEFNPVKAGLCRRPEEWEFSSARKTGFSLSEKPTG